MRYEQAFTPPSNLVGRADEVIAPPISYPSAQSSEIGTPTFNPFLRSPLPLTSASPDSLRQYYRSGVPQTRVWATQPPVRAAQTTAVTNPSPAIPGPYANDTAAAAHGVAIGKQYYQPPQTVVVRLS
jgi:hypothetical protein